MPLSENEEAVNHRDYHKRNNVPLEIICKKHYSNAKRKYCDQFCKDIEEFCNLQPNALAGVRLQRMFCVGMKVPKLEKYLSPEEERRLKKILNTPSPK